MKTTIVTTGLLAAALLAEPRARELELRYAPEAGTELTRTFAVRGEFESSLVDIGVEGMEIEIPDIDVKAEWTRRIVVTDELRTLRDGAPAELVRSFDELAHELEGELNVEGQALEHYERQSTESESDLGGTRVRFVWDADAEEYERSFVDDEDADVDLLEGLVEDMDLRALLPDDEVEVGDRWEVEPQAFRSVLLPGGELDLRPGPFDVERGLELAAGGIDPRMAGCLEAVLGEPGDRSGIEARLAEVREEDGTRLAVIELEVELETNAERIEQYEDWMLDFLPDEGIEVELETADVTFECSLEGQLLWDLEAGHARSLELTGDGVVTLNRMAAIDADGEEVSVEMELEMEGELAITVSIE